MAIPRECKRLAEVDFPIAVVSKHARREKSGPKGHPSMLHLWWARRPLASTRAMLLALLLPDPCDTNCPPSFKSSARELLEQVQGVTPPEDSLLRQALLKFIGNFASWDLAAHSRYLEVSRGLIRAAYPTGPPLVVDPFAGGGSIPLEALRLGCDAFASDLNPVANHILKVLLDDIPIKGPDLAVELRNVGEQINGKLENALREYYPLDPDGRRPIAYLWARTVRCETPNCGAEIPLVRSFWLSKHGQHRTALTYQILRKSGAAPQIQLEITEPKHDGDVPRRTVNRAKATCPACQTVLSSDRVRAQLVLQKGGADVILDENGVRTGGARLVAVVTVKRGERGRNYRVAAERDYIAIQSAQLAVSKLKQGRFGANFSPFPSEPTPAGGGSGASRAFSVRQYGMTTWGDLFTARQKLTLATISKYVSSDEYSRDLRSSLSCAVSRVAMSGMSCTRWNPTAEKMQHTFGRQALPMVWDFAEVVSTEKAPGNWESGYELVANVIEASRSVTNAQVASLDARSHSLPDESADVWFTDPPYYDAVPYADLSDFFLVWLKRTLPDGPWRGHQLDSVTGLSPKDGEIVVDDTKFIDGHSKDRFFFEKAMADAFTEGRRVLADDGIASVIFAHKTTEGWEALLQGITNGGWTITASWPVATEMGSRLRARDSAALATSVHLVCRPRPDDAKIGEWADVLTELPGRVQGWMTHLQSESIRGADLVFACIGPALEIYSRYSRVLDSQDRLVPLGGNPSATDPHERGYLAYVWEVVGRAALRQVLGEDDEAGRLEEDARLVALFLWTLQSSNGSPDGNSGPYPGGEDDEETLDDDDEDATSRRRPKGYTLIYDVARRFAQPLGIHLEDWENRIIETKKGVVRLLPVAERAKQLFGEDGTEAVADRIEKEPTIQLGFFPEVLPKTSGRPRRKVVVTASDETIGARLSSTTLDRIHIAMLLQASGRSSALRALLAAEQQRGPEFDTLANSLSALYPRDSEEKRLLDAMLLAMPR